LIGGDHHFRIRGGSNHQLCIMERLSHLLD
jgi:hypothetical protein